MHTIVLQLLHVDVPLPNVTVRMRGRGAQARLSARFRLPWQRLRGEMPMSWHYDGKRSLYLENLVTLHPPEQVKDDFSTHYEPLHEISVDSEDECDAADRAKAIAQVLGPCS
jgi:hypothetical protein